MNEWAITELSNPIVHTSRFRASNEFNLRLTDKYIIATTKLYLFIYFAIGKDLIKIDFTTIR